MSYTITEKCNGCMACVKFCPVFAISGERKKLHKIDPELCVDCGVCGRVCPESAILDEKGMLAERLKRDKWPRPHFKEGCVACVICIERCPFGCLSIKEPGPGDDKHSFAYLKDERSCVGCALCERSCPLDVIFMKLG